MTCPKLQEQALSLYRTKENHDILSVKYNNSEMLYFELLISRHLMSEKKAMWYAFLTYSMRNILNPIQKPIVVSFLGKGHTFWKLFSINSV